MRFGLFLFVFRQRRWFRRRHRRAARAFAKLIEPRNHAFVVLIAVDEFLQQRFGAREVSRSGVGIGELAQRGIQPERIARSAAEINQHFQRFGISRQALAHGRQRLQELILLARLDHGAAQLAQELKPSTCLIAFD